jgi:hypothetical protein
MLNRSACHPGSAHRYGDDISKNATSTRSPHKESQRSTGVVKPENLNHLQVGCGHAVSRGLRDCKALKCLRAPLPGVRFLSPSIACKELSSCCSLLGYHKRESLSRRNPDFVAPPSRTEAALYREFPRAASPRVA